MNNFEEQIEKYRQELLEFSKNNPAIHIQPISEPESVEASAEYDDMPEAVETITKNVEVDTEPKSEVETVNEKKTEINPEPIRLSQTEKSEIASYEMYDSYEDFISKNGARGTLKVQVTAGQTIPVSNAKVDVSVALKNSERNLVTEYTDIDGIVDNISLPAPPVALSLNEENTAVPFSVYTIKISHPDYAPAEYQNAPIFESVKSIQPVTLVPLTENGDEPGRAVYDEHPMVLYGGEK